MALPGSMDIFGTAIECARAFVLHDLAQPGGQRIGVEGESALV